MVSSVKFGVRRGHMLGKLSDKVRSKSNSTRVVKMAASTIVIECTSKDSRGNMQTQIRQNDNLQQFLTCGVHLSLAICFFPNPQPPCCLHVSSLAQAYVPWPPHTAGCRASHGRRLRPPPAIVVDHCWLPDIPWSPTSSRRVVLVASCTDLQVTDQTR